MLDNFSCDIMKLSKKPVDFYKDIPDNVFNNVPIEKLPIRCSDTKRKTFYGNNPTWIKDFDIHKEFMLKLVDVICQIRNDFYKKHPNLYENDITCEIMNSIIINISKIYDEKTTKQIINYIALKTQIER